MIQQTHKQRMFSPWTRQFFSFLTSFPSSSNYKRLATPLQHFCPSKYLSTSPNNVICLFREALREEIGPWRPTSLGIKRCPRICLPLWCLPASRPCRTSLSAFQGCTVRPASICSLPAQIGILRTPLRGPKCFIDGKKNNCRKSNILPVMIWTIHPHTTRHIQTATSTKRLFWSTGDWITRKTRFD